MALTTAEFLSITRVCIEKLTELTLRDLDADIRLMPTLNITDEMYKKSYWKKFTDSMGAIGVKREDETKTPARDEEKWNLILEVYGHLFPELPSKDADLCAHGILQSGWMQSLRRRARFYVFMSSSIRRHCAQSVDFLNTEKSPRSESHLSQNHRVSSVTFDAVRTCASVRCSRYFFYQPRRLRPRRRHTRSSAQPVP